MSIDDSPRRTRRPVRVKLSGCALRHTEDECDCVRPGAAEPATYLCPHCSGCGEASTGIPCGDCRGWGELNRYGDPTHSYSFPGTSNNADSVGEIARRRAAVDDPWAGPETVLDVDPWFDPDAYEPPF